MTDEFFPIKQDPACKSKWAWSTIWFYDGTTASCHRCDRHKINIDDFDNFHNTPQKLSQRSSMLNGQWPSTGGCDYCQKTERAGGYSDRQFQNSIPNQTPPELINNPTAVVVTPTILEIFLANTCNLACIYCRPANSSKIEKEFNVYGPFKAGDVHMRNNYKAVTQKIDTEAELKVKFWDWMDRKSSALRRFHILGGEPMLQQDFMKCLEHWEDHPNPDVELNIISNLMVPEKQFETYIDYIKQLATTGKIKRFDLTASIDSWFPEQEYVRMGLDLEVFEKNMEYLMQQDESWLRINVNQTVSALTIKQMPTLIRKINKWKGQRTEFGHYFQKLTEPALMAPTIFPPEFFKASFNDVIAEMQNVTWDEQHAYKMMKGMIAQIDAQAKFDPEKISQLESYLNEIDDRRGSTWDLAFPWLCDWLTAYNRNR